MDSEGAILILGLLVIVLCFLLLGNGVPKVALPTAKKKPVVGVIVTVIGPDGKPHKAQILPDEKPKGNK